MRLKTTVVAESSIDSCPEAAWRLISLALCRMRYWRPIFKYILILPLAHVVQSRISPITHGICVSSGQRSDSDDCHNYGELPAIMQLLNSKDPLTGQSQHPKLRSAACFRDAHYRSMIETQ